LTIKPTTEGPHGPGWGSPKGKPQTPPLEAGLFPQAVRPEKGGEAVEALPPGLAFFQQGQRYAFDRIVSGVNLAGRPIRWVVLTSVCADCGAGFEVTQPLGGSASLARRCKAHRQPGRPARRPGTPPGPSGPSRPPP
jgi:hypothetical protein